jgi:protein-tyrosine phosphatase
MTSLRARQVQTDDFENFDLILAMDQSNLAELRLRAGPLFQHKLRLLLDYADGNQQEVPDPYYGDGEGFDRVLDLVESACDGLLNSVLGHAAK